MKLPPLLPAVFGGPGCRVHPPDRALTFTLFDHVGDVAGGKFLDHAIERRFAGSFTGRFLPMNPSPKPLRPSSAAGELDPENVKTSLGIAASPKGLIEVDASAPFNPSHNRNRLRIARDRDELYLVGEFLEWGGCRHVACCV
jgi:hypothetical protein